MKKVITIIFILSVILILVSCSVGYTSQEPCAWCDSTPTKMIKSKTHDTEAYYYCEKCSTTCGFCDEKAVDHYTCGLGAEVFVCQEHKKEIM